MVAVAQLVESQIVILVVVGSNPISHPKVSVKKPAKAGFFASARSVYASATIVPWWYTIFQPSAVRRHNVARRVVRFDCTSVYVSK